MSMNKTWAISSWISFLTSAGIPIYLDMYATEETSQQRSRPSRSIIWDRAEQLAHCHPIHLFFLRSRVPVVQRREQGFLKESCTKSRCRCPPRTRSTFCLSLMNRTEHSCPIAATRINHDQFVCASRLVHCPRLLLNNNSPVFVQSMREVT